MPYTAIYSIYRDVGHALGDCICHTLPYRADTGMWALLWGTEYAIHCHIQQIQGCGPCSGGLYMPYTAIYSPYRDVAPALEDCICHILPYTAHTGMWSLVWKTVYAIYCYIVHIQRCGTCSGGLYMPYTAIYSTYRDMAPALGGLYMPYTAICSTYRDVGHAPGDSICHTLPYTAHTGMWGLLWRTVYAIHCHIQHIQGCGACSGGMYIPYTAIYSIYRDVGPALAECICHTL